MRAAGFLWLGAGLAALSAAYAYVPNPLWPRGLRNNNPGNIRAGDKPWLGQVGVDENGFVIFSDPFYGLRAMAVSLIHKGSGTLYRLGLSWSPPADNRGDATYGIKLAGLMGESPDRVIRFSDRLDDLLPAITRMENTLQPYSGAQVAEAINAAKAYVGA